MPNFKYFSPIQRLNAGLIKCESIIEDQKINLFGGKRYHRFVACGEAFRDNLLGLNWILCRIGEHFKLTYTKSDRIGSSTYRSIENTVLLSLDLEAFVLKMKEILDSFAFFVPFYYKNSPKHWEKIMLKDARDLNSPWAFRSMREHFINGKTKDETFRSILKQNYDWTEDILWKRDILYHKFHRSLICCDYNTHGCYAFIYEFNKKRDFIPNVLLYVSNIYFKLARFLKHAEAHFKETCEKEFSNYQYFHDGSSYSNRMDKTHYFFLALGRMVEGKILIRIHPNLRGDIDKLLNEILSTLKFKCKKCKKYKFVSKPTTEHFVLISSFCHCGNRILLNDDVSKRFVPHFLDRNSDLWDLVPIYKIEEKITF